MEEPLNLAIKDCRVCNRRRIKCDRKQPTCGKCQKRGLTCSGYGVILRWDQGVASRGNLKGKHVPVQSGKGSPRRLDAVPNSTTAISPIPGRLLDVLSTSSPERPSVPPSLTSHQLQLPEHRRLLHHYDRVVAPNMAWADSPDNPWRQLIIPLAFQSTPLMSAVLAFAAKHIDAITFKSAKDSSNVAISNSNIHLQRAMQLLAREVEEITLPDAPMDRSNVILATMLMLCNVETVWPDSPIWQVHLNAARTVMASRQRVPSAIAREDTIFKFLEQELFIANTFASTTNFSIQLINETSRPAISESGSIFVEFLKLIEMVTCLERQAAIEVSILSGITLSGLRKLFEHARSRIQTSTTYDYLHLGRAVNCFYHAGMIYACRAILKGDQCSDASSKRERDIQITASTSELFGFLDFAEPSKPTFAQDLVWPLFIAGTEATQKYEQMMVTAKLQQAMSGTGFSNCQEALHFLDALWERRGLERCTADFDWICFAREWTGQGRTFLVF